MASSASSGMSPRRSLMGTGSATTWSSCAHIMSISVRIGGRAPGCLLVASSVDVGAKQCGGCTQQDGFQIYCDLIQTIRVDRFLSCRLSAKPSLTSPCRSLGGSCLCACFVGKHKVCSMTPVAHSTRAHLQ
jgi:hypothetical protein